MTLGAKRIGRRRSNLLEGWGIASGTTPSQRRKCLVCWTLPFCRTGNLSLCAVVLFESNSLVRRRASMIELRSSCLTISVRCRKRCTRITRILRNCTDAPEPTSPPRNFRWCADSPPENPCESLPSVKSVYFCGPLRQKCQADRNAGSESYASVAIFGSAGGGGSFSSKR